MDETLAKRFQAVAPPVDFCSLRFVRDRNEHVVVRQDVLQPVSQSEDVGAMITIVHQGGLGYAATSDLSESGLKTAVDHAKAWADHARERSVVDFDKVAMPAPKGEFRSEVKRRWDDTPIGDKIDLAKRECARLKTDDRVVDWNAILAFREIESLYLTADGGEVVQHFEMLMPGLGVTANAGGDTVTRRFGGFDYGRQGGMEVIDILGFHQQAPVIVEEVLQLLAAENCPTGTMDALLDTDQMYLQIHESIGHPLELDRILGDERNYAGTTFVTLDMLGTYRYGSDLLNITYDPTIAEELATFAYDDDGLKAEKTDIIREGILQRALGGTTSQSRAGVPGVANSRASGWNRPPIDRMANLNLESGDSTFEEMVKSIEDGVYMKRNTSWSIDDSRNKFQFGCEYGRRIKDGELREVVKKPCYKGISATFWRSLAKVGNRDTFRVHGTPYCGKGEPNQVIRVGHATPACVFTNIDIFGGE